MNPSILSQTETDMQDIFKYDGVVFKQKRNRKQHSSRELYCAIKEKEKRFRLSSRKKKFRLIHKWKEEAALYAAKITFIKHLTIYMPPRNLRYMVQYNFLLIHNMSLRVGFNSLMVNQYSIVAKPRTYVEKQPKITLSHLSHDRLCKNQSMKSEYSSFSLSQNTCGFLYQVHHWWKNVSSLYILQKQCTHWIIAQKFTVRTGHII